jgi:parallel beta-helix repeat protein
VDHQWHGRQHTKCQEVFEASKPAILFCNQRHFHANFSGEHCRVTRVKVAASLADLEFMTTTLKVGSFLLLALGAHATTYYVDPATGNDFASSFSSTPALKTLDPINSQIYYPGDKILLKAGYSYSNLNITTSDATGDPILVSAYGTGPAPTLRSANLSNATGVTISGLTLSGSSTLIKVSGGHNNTVTRCTLTNAGTFGVYVSNSPYFTFSDNTYADTGTHVHQGKVLNVTGSSGSQAYGNQITINSASRGVASIYIIDSNDALAYSNTIGGGSQAIGIKAISRNVTGAKIYGNTISGIDNRSGDGEAIEFTGRYGYTASGSAYRNYIQGNGYTKNAIGVYYGTNVAAYGNVILGPIANTALHYSSGSYGGLAYGNTIYNVPIAFSASSGSGLTIRNNIVSHAKTVVSTDNRATTTEGYNNFYASGSVGAGHIGNTITSDPKFVDATPSSAMGVKLVSGSPNINSGTSLTSTYKYANAPTCSAWPCAAWDQSANGWNRGAFGF